jgi:hypothetical protein
MFAPPTFYKWRAKYGGMDTSMIKRLKELEEENSRLKRMYANVQMDNDVLKEALTKKFQGLEMLASWFSGPWNLRAIRNVELANCWV